jgi:hypothetical protein
MRDSPDRPDFIVRLGKLSLAILPHGVRFSPILFFGRAGALPESRHSKHGQLMTPDANDAPLSTKH